MIYRFADCVLYTQLYTLHRAGQSTRLAPKVFEVLRYLIEHRDRVISKQELCDQVWEGLAISDATLESCLRAVRLSVGDSGQAQRIIQTLRGHGYRFVADLELPPLPDDTLPPPLEPDSVLPPAMPPPPLVPVVRPCVVCQHSNPEDATFCAACGARLRQPCAHCGQDVPLPATFCTVCGQPLVAPSPPGSVAPSAAAPESPQTAGTPPSQGGLGAERKLVTVLCCTVAPAVAPEARVDLDALHSLMQALHDLAQDVVQQYGGWLQPVLGDRLLVMFGVPVVQEDHARRAVQVALALRQRGHALRAHLGGVPGAALVLSMGLHTGLVVTSRWDDTASAVAVVGDVVSLAVALQAQAEPGQILCSDATAHLVRETVRLEAVRPIQVAGQAAPITAYAVMGSRTQRIPGGQPHEGRVLSPFVGREREMATLHALLAQVEAGRGQVIGVVGEAGLGKSRLVSEFSRSLADRPLTYLTGRCLSYGSATPSLPLLDLLRHHCGITEVDGPEDITTKVHHGLQEVDLPPETWAPVFLPLLGVQEDAQQLAALRPEERKTRILTAFTQLCLNGSRQRPLVLEIEDLHWLDASSAEVLAALVERMAGVPLLLLVTYRPGYRPAWSDKSYVTQVALQPLTQQDSLHVLRAVLPTAGQSTAAVSPLLEKAEGNPFFLEELAQMVVEQGLEVSTSLVPDTVQAVLMARIDRLPATAKRLLQVASVIGKDVALPLLQAVTDVSEEAMYHDLSGLQAAEFLYETYIHAAPVYTFKHVLTQEVTYQSLVRPARQQYHARIAQVLEERFPEVVERQPELLAQHYTEASFPEQALPYWQRAGQRAIERSADVEAISHLTKGLEILKLLPNTPARIRQELELQLALGSVLRMVKGHTAPDVEHTYTRAYELSQQMGDSPQRFAALVSLWRFYFNQAKLQTAQELAEQCFTFAQHVQDPGLLQDAYRMLGGTSLIQGEPATARAHLEQGIILYDAQHGCQPSFSGGMDRGVTCRSYAAWSLWLLGYPEQALAKIHDALTLAQELSHAFSLAFALNYASLLHVWRREVQFAKERAEAVITLANEHGFIHALNVGMIRRGWALAKQGAIAEGIGQLHQGLAALRDMGQELPLSHHLALLAEAYKQGGQVEASLHALAEALAHLDSTGERYYEAELHRLKGEYLRAQTDKRCKEREAEECFRQALDVARRQQAKSLQLRAAMSLGRLWQQQGKCTEAHQILAEIYGWFTEGFETPDLQEAKALLEALGDQ